MRFAGTPLEIAQPHDAHAGCRGKVGQRPVPRLTQFPDHRPGRFAAHRSAPGIFGYYTAVSVLLRLYVFVTFLLPSPWWCVYDYAYVFGLEEACRWGIHVRSTQSYG